MVTTCKKRPMARCGAWKMAERACARQRRIKLGTGLKEDLIGRGGGVLAGVRWVKKVVRSWERPKVNEINRLQGFKDCGW